MHGKTLGSKRFGLFSVFFLILLLSSFFSIPAAAKTNYNSTEQGVSFTVPDGWEKQDVNDPSDVTFRFKFAASNEEYIKLECSSGSYNPRDDSVNIWKLAKKYVVTESEFSVSHYNGYKYYEAFSSENQKTYIAHFYNNKYYVFSYYSTSDEDHTSDFYALMNTVTYANETPPVSSQINKQKLNDSIDNYWKYYYKIHFINLLLTIAVFSLPLIIYRSAVLRRPISPKKARKISILYGICVLIVMNMIFLLCGSSIRLGGAIFWSFANYFILSSGYRPEQDPDYDGTDQPQNPTPLPFGLIDIQSRPQPEDTPLHSNSENTEVFCSHCGSKLMNSDQFCTNCGHVLTDFDHH